MAVILENTSTSQPISIVLVHEFACTRAHCSCRTMVVQVGGGDGAQGTARRRVPEALTLGPRERSLPLEPSMARAPDVVRLLRTKSVRVIDAAPVVEAAHAPLASDAPTTNAPLTSEAAQAVAADMSVKLRKTKRES